MKKAVWIFALLILSLLPVQAEVNESVVTIDLQTRKEIAPDTAKIRFYVENSGINIDDLKSKNDKIVASAIENIKKNLNSNESIKTISYSIQNVYTYKDKIRIFQKYNVKNGFEVKLKDLSKVSKIIQIATDSDVNRVDNINFFIEDSEKYCNELIKDTIISAKNRAYLTANALGSQLDRVKSVYPHCSLDNKINTPRYYATGLSSKASLNDSNESVLDTIEPGYINASASVNLTYYLK